MPNNFSFPIAIKLYGGKTAILLGSDSIEPLSVLIEDVRLFEECHKTLRVFNIGLNLKDLLIFDGSQESADS
ncbi:hypothetical protein COU54_02015 [Candidatus Pacearchaeota archaeon CG10_big_fil_rev_8_21_14_0_10_31_24]|nr:MAG: hypothetical protein COU54_02015 [Candidatus Pacearchaeota archaeon CG10_big_fil_rev_8_21_14_0_10_31_24]